MKINHLIVSAVMLLWFAFGAQPSVAAKSKLFKELVEGARKEKQVYIFMTSSGSEQVTRAFKQYLQRLGLDIDLKVDAAGGSFRKVSQAIGETKQGIAPTYDVQFGGAHESIHLIDAGGVKKIDNIDQLLSDIAPQARSVLDKISPGPFRARAFTFGHWIKAILYNTKLISPADLPKSHKELADPKYKGMFAIPPWTSDADAAVLVYNKEEALEIIKGIGKNKADTLRESAAVNRMLLGEFKFVDGNEYYYHQFKAKDPKAPIGLAFFRDYTTVNEAMYFVREGSRHPNAATLFVLWKLSKEGQQVFEKAVFQPNLYLPSSKLGREVLELMKAQNVRFVSYVDSEASLEKLRWIGQTPEGKKWAKAVAQAWRHGWKRKRRRK
jgi:ABC-type Fe3+ transport system substrate-binding protein